MRLRADNADSLTMPEPGGPESRRSRIYSVVALIPPGRVATYGRIAALAGLPGQARQVGYALAALPEGNDVPWHRVVNARGEISLPRNGGFERQKARLEAEGVRFDAAGRIELERFDWDPETSSADAVFTR